MADENSEDASRREAGRIRKHADQAYLDEERSIFQRTMHSTQNVQYLTQEELERHRRLIIAEPALSRLAKIEKDISARHAVGKAFSMAGEIIKKISAFAVALAALFIIFRDIIQGLAK